MSSYQDYANAVSNILEKQGEAQARAAEQTGQIWGGAVSNIGQYIAQIPEQRAKLQEIQNRAALTALETQREQRLAHSEQRAQLGQQQINDTVAKFPRNADGTVNTGLLYQQLSANPNAPPDQIDKVVTSVDRMNDFTTKYNQTQRDKVAEWANNALSDHKPDEPITWDAVHFHAALAPKGFISPDDQQTLATAEQQGADPRQVLNGLKRLGSQYNKPPSYEPLPPESGVLNKTTGEVTTPAGTKEPKTKEELALAIQKLPEGDPKRAIYQKAFEALNTSEAGGAAADERYRKILATPPPLRSADDNAWAAAYKAQKTLGVDTTAAAAEARMNKSEAFQRSEKGLDRLDKVNQAYHTAQSGVDTLRETIQSAAKGNVTAAAQQSLLTTMATLKAEGFNRINTAEIGSTKDAGSLVQNIEGWWGKASAGQPIPASVQKDMLDYANILEKAAQRKYLQDFNSVKQTYGLTNAAPEVAPTSTAPSTAGKNPFR